MKKIKKIVVEDIGAVFASDGEIKGVEMDGSIWYKQGYKEFNGKYVIEIEYYEFSCEGQRN